VVTARALLFQRRVSAVEAADEEVEFDKQACHETI
jgi:hypothetical protein